MLRFINTISSRICLLIITTAVLVSSAPLFIAPVGAADDAPTWINITTLEYKGIEYIDSTWDDTYVYAPAGMQNLSDDELDANCEIFINVPGFGIAFTSAEEASKVTGDISSAPAKAANVELHENVKSPDYQVSGGCEIDDGEPSTSTHSPELASRWFYDAGESLIPFFPSAGPDESAALGEYIFYRFIDGGRSAQYTYGASGCQSLIEYTKGNPSVLWTIRNEDSCDDGTTKGTAQILVGPSSGALDPTVPTGGVGSVSGNQAETCESTGFGMGWLVCGVLRIIDNTIGFIVDSFIVDGLGIEFKQNEEGESPNNANQVSKDSYDNTHALWASFRTIANIMFVVGFLVMIFGQTFGLDAYMVKKMAPRIAIAAIMVQLSWVISVEVLHWVNIIGGNIDTLIYAPFGGVPPDPPFLGGGAGLGGLVLFSGFAIASAMGLIGSLALGVTIALALLGSFATVVFRNILIFILLILSPVAAVLWILPNTDKYAKMWWSWFIKALLVYPMIIGLIAIGKVASTISTVGGGSLGAIMGIAVYFAPYFMIPFVFKFAGGAIASISQYAQGGAKKIGGKTKEREQPRVKERRERAQRGGLYQNKFLKGTAGLLSRSPLNTAGRVTGTSLGGKSQSRIQGVSMQKYNEAMQTLQASGISDDRVLNAMAENVMSVRDMEAQAKVWDGYADNEQDDKKAAEWRGRAASMRSAKQFAGNDAASVGALLLNQSYGFSSDEAVAGLNNSVADAGTRAQLLNYGGALAKRGGRFDQGPNTFLVGEDGKLATKSVPTYTSASGKVLDQVEYDGLETDAERASYTPGTTTVAVGDRSGLPAALKSHEFFGQKPSSLKNTKGDYVNTLRTGDETVQKDVRNRLLSALSPQSNMDVKSQEHVRDILKKAYEDVPVQTVLRDSSGQVVLGTDQKPETTTKTGWDDAEIDRQVRNLYGGRFNGPTDSSTGGAAGEPPPESDS